MQTPSETFYRARNNVISMLIDRNYVDQSTRKTEDLQKRYISEEEFNQLFLTGGIAIDLAGILTKEGLPVYVTFRPEEIAVDDLYKAGPGIFQTIAETVFNRPKFQHDSNFTDLRKFFQDVKVIVVFVAKRNNKNKYLTTVEKSFTIPEFPNVELWPVHRLQVN